MSASIEAFGAVQSAAIENLLRSTARSGGFVEATTDEATKSERFFEQLFRHGPSAAVDAGLRELGFVVDTRWMGDGGLTVVREAPGAETGKGLYIIRHSDFLPVAIQAPHRFTDLETGTIAARLMAAGKFAAAAWNTVPRRYEAGGALVPADLAHTEHSHLNAFTRAFARVHVHGLVVQLHGFETRKRRTRVGRSAELIVSGAARLPGARVRMLSGCLSERLGWRVKLYPDDVRELGGTTNANAAAMRATGSGDFLHLELARPVRRALARNDGRLLAFAECLLGSRGAMR